MQNYKTCGSIKYSLSKKSSLVCQKILHLVIHQIFHEPAPKVAIRDFLWLIHNLFMIMPIWVVCKFHFFSKSTYLLLMIFCRRLFNWYVQGIIWYNYAIYFVFSTFFTFYIKYSSSCYKISQ